MNAGSVAFVTGLPSSGKSTFARTLQAQLLEQGAPACVLDGDAVREALVPAPGDGPRARADFYEMLARLAALLSQQGLLVIVAATASRADYRDRARRLAPRFVEVFVDVPVQACRERDSKGLYAAYKNGTIAHVPGEDEPYEPPSAPDVVAQGGHDQRAVREVVHLLMTPLRCGVDAAG